MKQGQLKAVIFDHDGTLVDSEACHCDIWNGVLAQWQAELSFDEFARDCIGVPVDKTAEHFVERFQLPVTGKALEAQKEHAVEVFLQDNAFPLIDHALELVKELDRAGLKLGLASGAARHCVDATLDQHHFRPLIQAHYTGSEVSHNKPHPEVSLKAPNDLNVDAKDCAAIEDSASGIASAKAAGLYSVALHHPFIDRDSLSQADAIFEDHQAILQHLQGLIA